MPTLIEIQNQREQRKAAIEKQRKEQELIDTIVLNDLEQEHGDARVFPVKCATYTPGYPTFVVLRLPSRDELKRYQDMNKQRGSTPGDPLASAILVAETCRLYPDLDGWRRLLEVQPGVDVIAGSAAVQRVAGKVEEEGKS